jgi:thymidine kinase
VGLTQTVYSFLGRKGVSGTKTKTKTKFKHIKSKFNKNYGLFFIQAAQFLYNFQTKELSESSNHAFTIIIYGAFQ